MRRLFGRSFIATAALLLAAASSSASAQLFYSAPDLSTPPVTGAEPELALNLPGASADELKAGLVWHLRVAMNVAALQCDFEPTLLTVSNYNAALAHHKAELGQSFATLGRYFARVSGGAKSGDRALDQYNTRIYSSYSTVHAQKDFCNTMGRVGREAIFADRGALYRVAQTRMGEVRKALVPSGERYFTNATHGWRATLPLFTKKCWKKDRLTPDCEKAWEKYAASRNQ